MVLIRRAGYTHGMSEDLQPRDRAILEALKSGPLQSERLADLAAQPKAMLGLVARRLEELGYLEKRTELDPERGRRQRFYSITAAGLAVIGA